MFIPCLSFGGWKTLSKLLPHLTLYTFFFFYKQLHFWVQPGVAKACLKFQPQSCLMVASYVGFPQLLGFYFPTRFSFSKGIIAVISCFTGSIKFKTLIVPVCYFHYQKFRELWNMYIYI